MGVKRPLRYLWVTLLLSTRLDVKPALRLKCPMQFSVWIERSNLAKAEIARKLGISRQSIHNLLNGSKPKPSLVQGIAKLSDGKVTLKDWCK